MIGQMTMIDVLNKDLIRYVRRISYEETIPFIMGVHYARRMPSISYAYGLYEGGGT